MERAQGLFESFIGRRWAAFTSMGKRWDDRSYPTVWAAYGAVVEELRQSAGEENAALPVLVASRLRYGRVWS